jgi:hypothetical protein
MLDNMVMLEVHKAHHQEALDEARRERLVRLTLGQKTDLWARLQKVWAAHWKPISMPGWQLPSSVHSNRPCVMPDDET